MEGETLRMNWWRRKRKVVLMLTEKTEERESHKGNVVNFANCFTVVE